ncbi:MAG: mannosyltransferase [Flavobacteriaceae bacterium]|nr:mannosyltransferase [Flavobacteriaceae bacterium]
MLLTYTLLFIGLLKLVQFEKWNFKFLFGVGVLFRLVGLFALPNLSQDFYRFIWDGQLFLQGISPYLSSPNQLIEQGSISIPNQDLLFDKMGALSASHYSNYPPLHQLVFVLGAWIGGSSIWRTVIFFKIILLLADVGVWYFGKRLLERLHISAYAIYWYFLNPMILLEFSGNLHFEGLMLFFLLTGLYCLAINQWKWAAMAIGASISVKLLPLVLLPFFLPFLKMKKSIVFFLLVGIVNIVLFLPFYTPDFIAHYLKTIGLWFTKFEFNASLYYIARWIGYQITGYNTIHIIGKYTPWLVIALVMWFAWAKSNVHISKLLQNMLWFLSSYFFISTTVHPWYLSSLLILTIFTGYRFVLVWTFGVVWSYMAYSDPSFAEAPWALWIEYLPVFLFLIYELVVKNRLKI